MTPLLLNKHKPQLSKRKETKMSINLPHIEGTSEKLGCILRPHKIRFNFYTDSNVSRIFWADWYTHWTHKGALMVCTKWIHFQNLFLQILCKCPPWFCLFLDFFVKHFSNYLSFQYKKLFFVDDFSKEFIYLNKTFVWLQACESCKAIWS